MSADPTDDMFDEPLESFDDVPPASALLPGEKFLRDGDPARKRPVQRKPSSFVIPPPNDASVLLGHRYLNRGDGLILSGPSGMGKSSMQMQMSADWALAKPFHGIAPNGPLRSLIVQSEDSDGDIAEVWVSIHHAMKTTDTQKAQIDDRVRIVSDRVSRGKNFIASLKAHIAEFKPDIVWINPLQAFMDGDVTDSQDLGGFLREGLNGINDGSFGYALIHHTTKPATGKDRSERLWHEVMYDMAGGAELINWARAIISLRPMEAQGEFKIVLAKRGRRAGVVAKVSQGAGERLEPVTVFGLKHSAEKLPSGIPVIYWEPCDLPPPEQKKEPKGREPKFHYEEYHNLFPPKNTPGMTVGELYRALLKNGEIKQKHIHQVCKRWAEDGHIEIIDLLGQPRRYRSLL